MMTQKAIDARRPGRWKRRAWRNRYIYMMCLPVVAYFIIFKYLPMGYLSISFFDYKLLKGFSGSKWVGLKNFADFLKGRYFGQTLWNTVALNLMSLVMVFPAGVILAVLLNEVRSSPLRRVYQTITYLPYFISTVVLVSMITSFLSPSIGLLASVCKALGLPVQDYMAQKSAFRMINVLSGIWQNTGWNSIVYLATLTNIDPTLYEAATVDGAGRLRRIWHVSLPGLKQIVVLMLIMRIGSLMGTVTDKVLLLQNDLNLSVSELLGTYVYKMGLQKGKYSFATAVGLFNSVVSFLLVISANFVSKRLSDDTHGIF